MNWNVSVDLMNIIDNPKLGQLTLFWFKSHGLDLEKELPEVLHVLKLLDEFVEAGDGTDEAVVKKRYNVIKHAIAIQLHPPFSWFAGKAVDQLLSAVPPINSAVHNGFPTGIATMVKAAEALALVAHVNESVIHPPPQVADSIPVTSDNKFDDGSVG